MTIRILKPHGLGTLALLAFCAVMAGCVSTYESDETSTGARYSRFFTRAGEELTASEFYDALARHEAIFVGEAHTDETGHDMELAILEALHQRWRGKVVLAMEMFSRNHQFVIDEYLAGRMTEKVFVESAVEWSNYVTGYRDLVEHAREKGHPLVASNAPRSLARRVSRGGETTLEGLGESERSSIAAELMESTERYWKRFDRAIRGHGGSSAPGERLYSVQSIWDNTMGESCALALDANPGHRIVHVNGVFHSWDPGGVDADGKHRYEGTVRQLALRKPDISIATVALQSVDSLTEITPGGPAGDADFVVFCERRGTGLNQGVHSVTRGMPLRFRLSVPRLPAPEEGWPLLVWLDDPRVPTETSLRYWKLALGDECVIAIVEPPYPQWEDRNYLAARWYWTRSLTEDLNFVRNGIHRIEAYVTRHHPVDPSRIAIAGRDAGASIIATGALQSSDPDHPDVIAWEPEVIPGLAFYGLPDPIEDTGVRGTIHASDADLEHWRTEASLYRTLGRSVSVTTARGKIATEVIESRLRERWKLQTPEADGGTLLVLPGDRAQPGVAWAELYARALAARGEKAYVCSIVELVDFRSWMRRGVTNTRTLAFPSEVKDPGAARPLFTTDRLRNGQAIPRSTGLFGGTTVLVVPGDPSDEERLAWKALEDGDPLALTSRFHRLRIAYETTSLTERDGNLLEFPSLSQVLKRLSSEGRRQVLIAPAVFCAEPRLMRSLKSAATLWEESMTIEWLPGLGGQLYRTVGDGN